MIKINKLDNIYGIKSVKGAKDLKKNSVVYAPNGTAKSSISDALELIGNNCNLSEIEDVYHELPKPTFEIEVDDKKSTETNRCPFKVIKYSGVSDFDLTTDLNYANIVMSPNVSKKVSKAMSQITDLINRIKTLVDSRFPSVKKRKGYKESLAILANTSENDEDIYLKLVENIDLSIKPLSIDVSENMVLDLINTGVQRTCNSKGVIEGAKQYFEITNNVSLNKDRPPYLDDEFTLDNLQDFHKNAMKNNYYAKGSRCLWLNEKVSNQEDVELLIKSEISRVYGNEEAKSKFDEISKSFKNKKKLESLLKANPTLIAKLNNYDNLAKQIFITRISSVKDDINDLYEDILKYQKDITIEEKNCNPDDNIFTKIWSEFRSRFKFERFELKIDNVFNAVIGKEVPVFRKYIPGTNKIVTDPKELRFSTGEIKTFNLINFIISVETLRTEKTPFTIILDDAVDSFDYKNKYGIIDYLAEIKDDENIQLLIFTHNFDFYRSSIMAIGSKVGQYFAYRKNDGIINFYDTSRNKYLLSIVCFNSWKSNPTVAQYFALIPFSRNVLQLSTSSQDENVKSIDDYIHYEVSLQEKTINNLNDILDNHMNIKMPKKFNGTESYLDELKRLIEQIINKEIEIHETDLEYKIVMGLYIRIFLEKFLYENYKKNKGKAPTINNKNSRTRDLIKENEEILSTEDLANIRKANLISPAYAHVNSFMYEPLIDVSADDLINSVWWIHEKNNG